MSRSADLVVVGAGPVGLAAALAARSLGIGVVLLEAEPEGRDRPGSRALYVHKETLGRLDRMAPGLGSLIAEFGITWSGSRTYYAGREVHAQRYGPAPAKGLPPYASLRQVDTERFLLDACKNAGVAIEWGARVKDVAVAAPGSASGSASSDGVTVRTEDGGTWTAGYVIGADGARSAVRGSLGIAMDGERSGDYRLAVDLADDGQGDRIMHYRHPSMSGRNVLLVPFAGGLQIDLQCVSAAESAELARPEAVRRWLPRVLPSAGPEQILWIARYPCLQRVAETFVDDRRRVLLAGEAAHLFVPFGARGMNSGIADAEAAAAAVAVALRAAHPERAGAALADYDRVRRQAANYNRRCVDAALRHLKADTVRARAAQEAAARLASLVPPLGAWLDKAPYGPRGAVTLSGGLY